MTPEQRADLRADLGDALAPYTFSDAELDRLWARANGDYWRVVVLALDQLLATAAREIDYTIGQDSEHASQWFDHLTARRQVAVERIAAASTAATSGPRQTVAVPRQWVW